MDNSDAIRANGLVYSEVVNGAVVGLCMAADTLYTTTDVQGGFLFRRVPAGDAVITVEHLSIEPYSKRITIDPKNPNVFLTVRERSVEIDEVEVKGRVPVYVMSGDTIKYNVAATQKLAEGDMAGDVMSRLPGVTVDDGGFKVLGQSVAKTYVDSRLIFGDNSMNALQYLAASDIISIKVYIVFLIIAHQFFTIATITLTGTIFENCTVYITNRIEGRSRCRQVWLTNIQMIYMNSSSFCSFSQRSQLTNR